MRALGDEAGIPKSFELNFARKELNMLPMTYYLRRLEPRVVKLKGSPKMLKLVSGHFKLVEKNPQLDKRS